MVSDDFNDSRVVLASSSSFNWVPDKTEANEPIDCPLKSASDSWSILTSLTSLPKVFFSAFVNWSPSKFKWDLWAMSSLESSAEIPLNLVPWAFSAWAIDWRVSYSDALSVNRSSSESLILIAATLLIRAKTAKERTNLFIFMFIIIIYIFSHFYILTSCKTKFNP